MSINQYLKPFNESSQLRDYRHAARIFVDDNYRLMPKYGFLFHVAFDLNPEISRVYKDQAMEIGLMVKTVGLPKFTVDAKTLNAYNKPNVVQTKLKYDPVQIAFHDDSADVIREFWYDYYHYYYRDSDHQETTYQAATKYNTRQTDQWGYTPRSYSIISPGTQQYIKSIRIYSLHQKRFSEYTLINPMITSFGHGQHQQGGGEIVQSDMTVTYESIKYATGYVSNITVEGFADLHYDNKVSDITPNGNPNVIAGKNGSLQNTDNIIHDLADTSFVTYALRGLQNGTSTGKMVAGLLQPGIGAAMNAILGGANAPGAGFSIPSLNSLLGGTGNELLTKGAGLAGAAALASGAFTSISRSLGGNSVTSDGVPIFKEDQLNKMTPVDGFPSDNPSGVQTFDDGSSIQTFDDGSTMTIDSDGNVVGSTPSTDAPSGSSAASFGMQTFDDGSSIQTFDDGSTLVTDSDGNVTSTPSDSPSPVYAKTEQVEVDWNAEPDSVDSTESTESAAGNPDEDGPTTIDSEDLDW